MIQLSALLRTVLKFRIQQNVGNILSSCVKSSSDKMPFSCVY